VEKSPIVTLFSFSFFCLACLVFQSWFGHLKSKHFKYVELRNKFFYTSGAPPCCLTKSVKALKDALLVHGQVTIIFVMSVCLFVCAEFFSAVFDPISIKLGHMLYVWV